MRRLNYYFLIHCSLISEGKLLQPRSRAAPKYPPGKRICSWRWVWNTCEMITAGETWTKKVKCTLVQALRFCTGRTVHRESRGITLLFHDHGTRRRWGVNVTPRPLFTPGKDPVPIVQEAGWAPGPVWTGAENLAPHRFVPRTVQPVASRYTDWSNREAEDYVKISRKYIM